MIRKLLNKSGSDFKALWICFVSWCSYQIRFKASTAKFLNLILYQYDISDSNQSVYWLDQKIWKNSNRYRNDTMDFEISVQDFFHCIISQKMRAVRLKMIQWILVSVPIRKKSNFQKRLDSRRENFA